MVLITKFRNFICRLFHKKWTEEYREPAAGNLYGVFECHKCNRVHWALMK